MFKKLYPLRLSYTHFFKPSFFTVLNIRPFSNIRYTQSHEWIQQFDNFHFTIGITHHAQDKLGDIAYVDLPVVDHNTTVEKGEEICAIESTKTCADVAIPMDGIIEAVNTKLEDSPELINHDPEGEGWLFKIKTNDDKDFNKFMDNQKYQEYLKDLQY